MRAARTGAEEAGLTPGGSVEDRTIYEDGIFAKMLHAGGHINERDYRTYLSLFENMSNFMRRPNLIVHLDVSPEESLERIKERARGVETGITIEYLRALHAGYEEFISDISKSIPVISVNWQQFRSAEEMAEVVRSEWQKISTVRHIEWRNSGRESPAHISFTKNQ